MALSKRNLATGRVEFTYNEANRAALDIRHSEPHYPGNPCSASCTGYAPTQNLLKARRKQARRERDQAKRDLGLRRAPGGAFGGWE